MKANGSRASGKPDVLELDMEELEGIVDRIRRAGTPEEDCKKLDALVDTVAWLQQELASKDVSLARLRSLFGLNTSEKTKDVLQDESGGKPAGDSIGGEDKPKDKRKGHGRKAAKDYEGAERVQVEYGSLEPGDPCPACPTSKQGKVYAREPRTLVRVTGGAPVRATVYELESLRCNLCGQVFNAKPPKGIGDKKYDATAASMIGLLKYGSGLPFNRLERLEGNLGIPLPAATQWEIVNEAAGEIRPVVEELIRQAAQGRLVHNDDTSMQVLELRKEIDALERAGETDRTGIFTTGIVSELTDRNRVALFFTGRKHAGENIADLLARRATELDRPMQMCDGLDRNLPKDLETIVANCLAHARRKFVEVVNSFPADCRHVLETLRDVYANDAKARSLALSDDDRLSYHKEHSGALMDDLQEWMHQQIADKHVEPNSSLGKAIRYMTERWDRLTLFLRKPGAPLDNNVVERALKKAILHRKNSLFYKTENGARVGDIFMSLIHTAELARVNPFHYLTALLRHPAEVKQRPADWVPWNYTAAVDSHVAP